MNKKFLKPLLISIVLSFISVTTLAINLNEIDGKALEVMMADGKAIRIVDVREPDEFAAGHIKGAINIPFEPAKSRVLKELQPQERIVFVCHGGPMGHELGTLLAKMNYPEVYNLIGGMKKWRGEIVK
ncbi:MAG: rhodanese-like domain-containing protein [Nitrospirae bacterium]|nr:rhodanese-like domain-containing protein [Nitrospirota bacterium]MBI3595509.1 rhodanese-like domain-containing protein [Nitrospirota bacterium]